MYVRMYAAYASKRYVVGELVAVKASHDPIAHSIRYLHYEICTFVPPYFTT